MKIIIIPCLNVVSALSSLPYLHLSVHFCSHVAWVEMMLLAVGLLLLCVCCALFSEKGRRQDGGNKMLKRSTFLIHL